MSDYKRFYIFTGKGGVGKTTLAQAFTKNLLDKGKKAYYCCFKTHSLQDNTNKLTHNIEQAKKLDLPLLDLELSDCANDYIGRKMGSTVIASWITDTNFFKALINMIPGFNYLIYQGAILQFLNDNPEAIVILDSPSSGHAITMLESTNNFREIFQSGIVFNDATKMMKLMYSKNFLQVVIVTLATQMACHEAVELNDRIIEIHPTNTLICCNDMVSLIKGIEAGNVPDFLQKKIQNEKSVRDDFKDNINSLIPHINKNDPTQVVKDLLPIVDNLV
jgi:arsenite-transporting ATPase